MSVNIDFLVTGEAIPQWFSRVPNEHMILEEIDTEFGVSMHNTIFTATIWRQLLTFYCYNEGHEIQWYIS